MARLKHWEFTTVDKVSGGLGIVALLLGLLALFFKNKADNSAAANTVAETAIKDAPLAAKQDELQKKIDQINHQDDSKLTPEERAARWGK